MEQFDADRIEAYVLNNLPLREQTLFETALKTDERLAQAVANFSDQLQGIEAFGDQQFIQSLESVEQSLANEGFFLDELDIGQYLNGTATPQVEQQIQQRLKNDPAFAKMLATQKDLIRGIEVFGERDFMSALQEADQELANRDFFQSKTTTTEQTAAKTVRCSRRQLLSIAAVVGGLIIGVWVALPLISNNVFDENYVAYADELTPYLSETGFVRPDYLKDLMVGMELYNQRDYVSAKLAFTNYLQAAPPDEMYRPFANFYLAQTYLATGAVGAAIPLLENLVQRVDFQLQEDAQWYLALSNLEKGAEGRGKKLLQKLSNSTKYGERARKLR